MLSVEQDNLHFTLYSTCTLQLMLKSESGALVLQIHMHILNEENFGKQMTTVHLLYPKFL